MASVDPVQPAVAMRRKTPMITSQFVASNCDGIDLVDGRTTSRDIPTQQLSLVQESRRLSRNNKRHSLVAGVHVRGSKVYLVWRWRNT